MKGVIRRRKFIVLSLRNREKGKKEKERVLKGENRIKWEFGIWQRGKGPGKE